jgi:hypothetical protein
MKDVLYQSSQIYGLLGVPIPSCFGSDLVEAFNFESPNGLMFLVTPEVDECNRLESILFELIP